MLEQNKKTDPTQRYLENLDGLVTTGAATTYTYLSFVKLILRKILYGNFYQSYFFLQRL